MVSRKMAALAILAMVGMVAAAQPASAGVGGCGPRIGVGGCWQVSVAPVAKTTVVLDSLAGAIPYDMIAAMKAMLDGKLGRGKLSQPGDTTTQGVGGCRIGVGGCWL